MVIRIGPRIETNEVDTGSMIIQTKVRTQMIISLGIIHMLRVGRASPTNFITPKSDMAPHKVITVATRKKASQEFSFRKALKFRT